jgi:hypothetical protein
MLLMQIKIKKYSLPLRTMFTALDSVFNNFVDTIFYAVYFKHKYTSTMGSFRDIGQVRFLLSVK